MEHLVDVVTEVPVPANELAREYAPGSADRHQLEREPTRLDKPPAVPASTIGGE
ncbi:hypothetical protein [Spirillospora sp. CA-128828]|uniref:hypothetical protein n=1 Tax=Spirillospora sp. CA-128828 TaxID=3240033 RepID=UPI003D8BBC57